MIHNRGLIFEVVVALLVFAGVVSAIESFPIEDSQLECPPCPCGPEDTS